MSIITHPSGLDHQVDVRFGEYGLLATAAYASQWSGLELLFSLVLDWPSRLAAALVIRNLEVPIVHSKNYVIII